MKKTILFCLAVFAVSLLTGCGTKNVHNFYPEEKFVAYGEVGEVKSVLVGDSIMHVQKEVITDILEVTRHIEEYNLVIPKGHYLKTGANKNIIYFAPKNMDGRWVRISGIPLESGWIEYHLDTNKFFPDSDEAFCLVRFTDGRIKKNERVKQVNSDFLYRSLAYGGSKKHLVSFIYREGDNEQRMTLNTKLSKTFKYQGCEVEVLDFDADSLTCKILSKIDLFD
jgi:predicted small lipoprotein YifL